MNTKFFLAIIFCLALSSCKENQENPTIPETAPYFPKVKSIIQNNCMSCHSASGEFSGRPVEFDTDEQIASQSASIKAAVADPVTITNKRMPQGGALSHNEISIIVK